MLNLETLILKFQTCVIIFIEKQANTKSDECDNDTYILILIFVDSLKQNNWMMTDPLEYILFGPTYKLY